MKFTLYLILLIFYVTSTDTSVYTDLKDNVLSLLKRSLNVGLDSSNHDEDKDNIHARQRKDLIDYRLARSKARVLKKVRMAEKQLNDNKDITQIKVANSEEDRKQYYHMDPVLNMMKRRSRPSARKAASSSTSEDSSSSLEMQDWKDEWKEFWLKKKVEAMNVSTTKGDFVNMVAARPWGVPCGDPNQHDMPWGTCMLAMECEPEYRIFRGDYFCGRTQFVCCALQLNSYDLYQGFDASFADSSLATDSEEKKNRQTGSKEKGKRRKKKEKRRRKRNRLKRKRQIKRKIKKIIKAINKILKKAYRNGTTVRKKKTKELKKFVKDMKKEYKQQRLAAKDIHETEVIKIDSAVIKKLAEIGDLNENFVKNSTFRDIVVNGTITKKAARMLVEAYPELSGYFETRRSGNHLDSSENSEDYLDYDIEYGLLYY